MNELSGAERFEQLSDENKARYLAINRQMVRLAKRLCGPYYLRSSAKRRRQN